jgi:glycerol-3-phosphate dehydrogenase
MRAIPSLSNDALVGGITYYDAQVDDARYVASLARTASFYGAHVASRVNVEGFVKVGERVVGVKAHDLQTGEHFEIRAKQVVNATACGPTTPSAWSASAAPFKVRASKGIHLVVPRDRIQSAMGMIFRTEKSVLFVIPWGRHWLIGTTDTDWNLDKAHPAATAADIDYLLEHVNAVLAVPLTREDVEGVFAGLRPLLAGESDRPRSCRASTSWRTRCRGLVVVAGGKWTTYRVMAKDAIDAAADAMDGRVPPSTTQDIPLLGAEGYQAAWNKRGKIARAFGVHKVRIEHLLNRYGTMTDELLDLIRADTALGEPLPGADDYLGPRSSTPRRTRAPCTSTTCSPAHPHLDRGLGPRDLRRARRREADGRRARVGRGTRGARGRAYLQRVAAERASQEQPDDASADRVRLEAPDIVKVD